MTEPTALATATAIRRGETTALAECDAAIARIEARDGPINAVVVRDFDRARDAARAVDAGPKDDRVFLGVPMTVKESFNVAGLPTTWGHEQHRDWVAPRDADAVARLKAAGVVILGKTNVPFDLADLQTDNPVYGRTNNPCDAARTSGGSSGGAAAALASGMVPLEIGSDIGGSIRTPAAFCGVWGHKSTYGALSISGQAPPGTDGAPIQLSVIGPMARDAEDLHAAFDVLASRPLSPALPVEARALRVLVMAKHPFAPTARAVGGATAAIGEAFARAGATVVAVEDHLPNQEVQFGHYIRLLQTTMARGQPSPEGVQATLPEWFAMLDEQARAQRVWRHLFTQWDAVIAPALGTTAFPHSDVPIRERMVAVDGTPTVSGLQLAFPCIATYPGLPATCFPAGRDPDGLPIGVQIITDLHQDHRAIAIAALAHDLLRS